MAVSDILSRCNILPGGFIILSEYQENGILELEDWFLSQQQKEMELIDSDYLHSDCYDDDEYEVNTEDDEYEYDCVNQYVQDCDVYDEYDKKTNEYEEKSQIDGDDHNESDHNENGINDGTIDIQDENKNNFQDIVDNNNNNNSNYNNEFNNIIDILLFGDGDNKNNDNIDDNYDDDEETSDNDGEFTDINDSETSVDSSEFEDNNDIGMTNLFIPGNDNYMYNMDRNINNLEQDKIYKLSPQGTKSRKPLNVLINNIIQYNYDIMDDEICTFLYDKYSTDK